MVTKRASVQNVQRRVTWRIWGRFTIRLLFLAIALTAFGVTTISQQNPIHIKNARLGTTACQLSNPANDVEVSQIEGCACATSVNRGGPISSFVRTTSPTFTIAIYRLGWHGGLDGVHEMAPRSFFRGQSAAAEARSDLQHDRMPLHQLINADLKSSDQTEAKEPNPRWNRARAGNAIGEAYDKLPLSFEAIRSKPTAK